MGESNVIEVDEPHEPMGEGPRAFDEGRDRDRNRRGHQGRGQQNRGQQNRGQQNRGRDKPYGDAEMLAMRPVNVCLR